MSLHSPHRGCRLHDGIGRRYVNENDRYVNQGSDSYGNEYGYLVNQVGEDSLGRRCRGGGNMEPRPQEILKPIAEQRVVSRLEKAMHREPLRVNLLRLVCKHSQFVPLRGLGSKHRPFVARVLSQGFEPGPGRSWVEKVLPSWNKDGEFDDHVTNLVDRSFSQTWSPSERDSWLQNGEKVSLHWRESNAAARGMTSRKYVSRQGSWLHSWEWTLCGGFPTQSGFPTGLHSFCEQLRDAAAVRPNALIHEDSDVHGPPISMASGLPISMACNLCKYALGTSDVPPEDIAVRAAQAVACFQAELEGTMPTLHAADVLVVAQNWRFMSDSLADLDPMGASMAVWMASKVDSEGRAHGLEELSGSAVRFANASAERVQRALKSMVAKLEALKDELRDRVHSVRWEMPTPPVLPSVELHIVTPGDFFGRLEPDRDFLLGVGCDKPVIAIIVDFAKLPKVRRGHRHCNCDVPWCDRSRWERLGFVEYGLPMATAPWKCSSGRWEGWWELESGCERPWAFFTIGTIPRPARIHDAIACAFLQQKYHEAYIGFREKWKEQLRSGRLRAQVAWNWSWPWNLDLDGKDAGCDACTEGSLWMFLQNYHFGNRPHEFGGEEYPLFKCLWHSIVKRPEDLMEFESLCHMESLMSRRMGLPAQGRPPQCAPSDALPLVPVLAAALDAENSVSWSSAIPRLQRAGLVPRGWLQDMPGERGQWFQASVDEGNLPGGEDRDDELNDEKLLDDVIELSVSDSECDSSVEVQTLGSSRGACSVSGDGSDEQGDDEDGYRTPPACGWLYGFEADTPDWEPRIEAYTPDWKPARPQRLRADGGEGKAGCIAIDLD